MYCLLYSLSNYDTRACEDLLWLPFATKSRKLDAVYSTTIWSWCFAMFRNATNKLRCLRLFLPRRHPLMSYQYNKLGYHNVMNSRKLLFLTRYNYLHDGACSLPPILLLQNVSPAPQFMGTCTASLMSHFVTCLLISVVYIIALCSSINTTIFFSLYVHCCPVLDLTVMSPVSPHHAAILK
jgi:hypothetical protein